MPTRAIAAAILMTSLGGCSLFNGSGPSKMASSDTDLSSYFEARLEAGRSYLKAGLPTRAVTAFRQASYDADSAAEAYNGMGVAYAMQGRDDVARRMFGKALEANPYDKRFTRNLARLDTKSDAKAMLAKDDAESEARTAASETGTMPQGELPPVADAVTPSAVESFSFPRTVTSSGGLVARTTKETRIATVDHGAAAPWSGVGGNIVGSTSTGTPVAVSQKATRNPSISVYKPNKDYPLRVAITGPKRAKAAKPKPIDKAIKPAGYPVRVALGSRSSDERR